MLTGAWIGQNNKTMENIKQYGIEKINVYATQLQLDLGLLATARGYNTAHLEKELMVKQRAINPPWEDTVTMAVNAAKPMLTAEDIQSVGLLIVATETGLDHEKSISSWVLAHLGLPSSCRHFEVKIACYAGTAALQMALAWLRSGLVKPGKKALVITSDESLIAIGKPWEYVCGAGAVALLVSDKPAFLEIEAGCSGIYAHEVADVIRPLPWLETGNSEHSLFSYMEALAETWAEFTVNVPVEDALNHFTAHVYHVPFSGIAYRAHKQWMRQVGDYTTGEIKDSFEQKVAPSILYPQRIGGTYAGSIFVAMLSLVDNMPELAAGNRIAVFSYGSGSCAEYYSAKVTKHTKQVAANACLGAYLSNRITIGVLEYEKMEQMREERLKSSDFTPDEQMVPGLFEAKYQGKGLLIYKGSKNYYRNYAFS